MVAASKMGQDPPPGRIGQGRKCPIQCLRRIFNHLVKYLDATRPNARGIFYDPGAVFFNRRRLNSIAQRPAMTRMSLVR